MSPPASEAYKPTPEHSDLDEKYRNASPVFIVSLVPPNRRHGQQRHAYRVRGLHAHLDSVDRSAWNRNTGKNVGVLKESLHETCDVLRHYDGLDKVDEQAVVSGDSVVSVSGLSRESSGGSITPHNKKINKNTDEMICAVGQYPKIEACATSQIQLFVLH